MLDTTSVFDVMASDEADRHVAQRTALALASKRLDNTVGRFLRGAVTMEEFEARLAACQDDFALHVAEACAEVGFDAPERLAKVLAADYARGRRWQPVLADKKVDPGEMQDSNDGKAVLEPHQDDEDEDAEKIKWSSVKEAWDGYENPFQNEQAAVDRSNSLASPGAAGDPWAAEGHDPYTCHGCGQGSVEFAEHGQCPYCGTMRGAQATAATKTAESGNTDLGGPEPKMDKRLWTPQTVGEPDVASGIHKDATEPIGPPSNEGELKEIGDAEHQSLPSNSGDAGFASGGEDSGPHTDTWSGKGDLASPVTHETQPE